MRIARRKCLKGIAAAAAAPLGVLCGAGAIAGEARTPRRFVRFEARGSTAYGVLEGDQVKELQGLQGWIYGARVETGVAHKLSDVKLLAPCEPTKIIAMAGNYKSHLSDQPAPKNPEAFFKPPSALLETEGTIKIPRGTADVHYEGELVLVIGERAKNVDRARAAACIFGVTCGNDVSARDWQANDRQWWRAKGSDTFAALGPWIVSGIDFGDLLLTTRVNGKEMQRARTSELIFDAAAIVSFLSQHVTLFPGDLIYTGTPGQTSAMKPGDLVEVEIENIGVLRNRVG
jgi:2-keto-4-pentenoate hydratase/2-oxohepta-3-ene-1,7-dioic acid hydratase in catechol pathway